MCDVLTLNYNDADTTIEFLKKIENYSSVEHILVVDNASTDDSLLRLKELSSDKIIVISSPQNGGYGAGNNLGIKYLYEHYRSQYILLSNPDVIVTDKTIEKLQSFLANNLEYAIASGFMCNPEGKRQSATAYMVPRKKEYILCSDLLYSKFVHPSAYNELVMTDEEIIDVGIVSGSMFMMRTIDMLKYGMYDENIFLYGEETVLALKFDKSPKKIALLPKLEYIHNHSVTVKKVYNEISKRRVIIKSRLYILKKHYLVNSIEYLVARALSSISIIELRMVLMLKRINL